MTNPESDEPARTTFAANDIKSNEQEAGRSERFGDPPILSPAGIGQGFVIAAVSIIIALFFMLMSILSSMNSPTVPVQLAVIAVGNLSFFGPLLLSSGVYLLLNPTPSAEETPLVRILPPLSLIFCGTLLLSMLVFLVPL